MKKIFTLLVLVILLAVAILPASAGNGPGNGSGDPQSTPQPTPQGQGTLTTYRQSSPRGTFAITGTITAIDVTEKTITVTVLRGNKLVKPYINLELTVLTTQKTKFLYKVSMDSPATAITFEELMIGDVISINGTLADDVFTARRVTKGASLECLP